MCISRYIVCAPKFRNIGLGGSRIQTHSAAVVAVAPMPYLGKHPAGASRQPEIAEPGFARYEPVSGHRVVNGLA